MLLFNIADAETITILRKGVRDWTGDPIDENSKDFDFSHKISGVLVDYQTTTSNKWLTDDYTVRGVLHMPVGSDVLPTDQVELADGTRVVVDGKPFKSALGFARGVSVRFRGVN
ncbi:head-to-tail stopper [Gordonia phage Syleon]|uniref:Head-to-tail stopper n=3 Tax=Octobienvirus TaxID=3044779 RepID=A0AAE8Y7C4_9CAUD|nr:head-to-tail stopper [Gordonia Phage Sephiroth]YP_010246537.1 head-to-tail stopper [Gordonia phage Kudefre]YP_010246678.1 head-to-tail stopper [Gordonia phage Syleon]QGH75748.1 head-to-tail stopper [Gordonia phage Syleon]QNN99363.1 head-to-tail stopper [Gordonia Phage Sephiroth]UDL15253.1 head-to-tail stopper [Gordonia phage Kudefre]